MNYYQYITHGLIVFSEIPLPELTSIKSEKADVLIRLGEVQRNPSSEKINGVCFQFNQNEFHLNIKRIASFYVKDGNEIVIAPHTAADERDIRLFLLGSVFGALLQQRNCFPLHASTVVTKQGALCLCGASGSGKSTLAVALEKEGFPIVSDDVTAITFENNRPYALPGPRRVKLWQDTACELKIPCSQENAIQKEVNKYNILIDPVERKTELKTIVIISTSNKENVDVQPVTGFEKLSVLIENTYRSEYLTNDQKKTHLQQCGLICNHVNIHQIKRPKTGFTLTQQIKIIKKLIKPKD
ncbi:MAG TPA: hypothetical protein P5107_12120 [Thermotogota bacterium]|nr:hypothetical protein [Thermotogota bacterium]HRW35790.1 hypothetical protein [Thermotogota bacterium]